MTIISKVVLTEEEEKIVEQAKKFYDALLHSTFEACPKEWHNDCDKCPLRFDNEYDDECCVISDLRYDLEKFIKGVE